MSQPDALVVGGGPAGAAVAAHLARHGRAVRLLEQSAVAHHKVCGEFLSQEAMSDLDRLGVDLKALHAVPIYAVRLSARKPIAACDLPFLACSLSRRALDEALLCAAAQVGVQVLRGLRVNAVEAASSRWTAHLSNGESHSGAAAFLATGKHDLQGHRRLPGRQNDLVAFKMHFRLAPAPQRALHGWVEFFVFPRGYAGLQLTENDDANLCLLVRRDLLHRCAGRWQALLAHVCEASPALAARLGGAEPLFPKPLALSSIPYGMLLAAAPPGLWRLGDQAAVIPSFAGEGISIALHSARRAAEGFLRGLASEDFARSLHGELSVPVRTATCISRALIAMPGLAQAARLWRPLLGLIASRTRIPAGALGSQE